MSYLDSREPEKFKLIKKIKKNRKIYEMKQRRLIKFQ